MRIAFYAPLKPPDHSVPSGDRRMARLLIEALRRGEHEVAVASRLRSRDGAGDAARQRRLAALGERLAARLIRRYEARPQTRPDLWFTYHLYHKAPDWIGPRVARALAIPYVVAEASVAAKQARGPWALGHRAALVALGQADRVLGLNRADREGVLPFLASAERWSDLAPFLDLAPFTAARAARAATRARLAGELALDPKQPWLIALAMMRADVKLDSYRLLGTALAQIDSPGFALLVAGDGPARAAVEAALAPLGGKCRFLGALAEDRVPAILAAADLFVWPALGEAYGLALLEAQAAGLPAVVGASGGVADIVADGITGVLVPAGDARAFAEAVRTLLADPARREQQGRAAQSKIAAEHDLDAAARQLDVLLRGTIR